MRTSYGVGRYFAAEGDLAAVPHRFLAAGATRGCIFLTGRGTNALGAQQGPNGVAVLRALADGGIPCQTADMGGTLTYGNDLAVGRVETARTYQQGRASIRTDKVLLCGISMGTVTALRYAMAHPTLVGAIALMLPVPDLQGFYDANIGGFATAEVGAAYGGRPTDAQSPAKNPAAFAGIPIHMWYATDDTTALPAQVLSFASATGASVSSLGAVGHSVLTVPAADVASFLAPYA